MTALDTRRLVVASDLHLAPNLAGSPAFVDFLAYLLESEPSHLVIAGDLFDVLAAADPPNEDGFDPVGAPRVLRATVSAHEELFRRLVRLAERPGGAVTILGGNHDVEVCLPTAQETLRELLGPNVRWFVHGEALGLTVGGARVVVEHGDLYDDWNRIDYGPLAVAGRLLSRGEVLRAVDLPPGSRIVAQFLNHTRATHRWLEWIKPETSIVPLVYALLSPRERLRLMRLVEAFLDRTAIGVERRLLRPLGPGRLVRAADGSGLRTPRQTLAAWYAETRTEVARSRTAKGDAKLVAKLRRTAAADGFFDPAVADPFAAELRRLPRLSNAQLVVLGHTHAAKALPLTNGLLYLNAGAWCPLVRLPSSDDSDAHWTTFLDALWSNSLEPEWRNSYVEVISDERACEARLLLWPRPTTALAAWQWNSSGYWSHMS